MLEFIKLLMGVFPGLLFLEGLSTANVDTLVIDPTDPNTLYAGLIYGGVSKTTDGGHTWFAVNQGIQVQYRYQLEADSK